MTQPPTRSQPTNRSTGSVLMGAVYSAGFYIAMSLAMTLGAGFGGVVELLWMVVAAAWLLLGVWFLVRPSTRSTGLGMVGSVAIIAVVFWLLGLLLSLVNVG